MSVMKFLHRMRQFFLKLIGLEALEKRILLKTESAAMFSRLSFNTSRVLHALETRKIDPTNPATWEFSGFSQNGEDGIIDYCLGKLHSADKTFVEIGASNGLENNSSYLAYVKKYTGIMVEGNDELVQIARRNFQSINHGVIYHSQMVEPNNVEKIIRLSQSKTPDFFSLDIDGIDYYVANEMMKQGFKPSLVCVEYNSLFGNEREVTIPYRPNFTRQHYHQSRQLYGVSIKGWIKFWKSFGYEFLTIDQNGVNAFFYLPERFPESVFKDVVPVTFNQNFTLKAEHRTGLEQEFKSLPLYEIP